MLIKLKKTIQKKVKKIKQKKNEAYLKHQKEINLKHRNAEEESKFRLETFNKVSDDDEIIDLSGDLDIDYDLFLLRGFSRLQEINVTNNVRITENFIASLKFRYPNLIITDGVVSLLDYNEVKLLLEKMRKSQVDKNADSSADENTEKNAMKIKTKKDIEEEKALRQQIIAERESEAEKQRIRRTKRIDDRHKREAKDEEKSQNRLIKMQEIKEVFEKLRSEQKDKDVRRVLKEKKSKYKELKNKEKIYQNRKKAAQDRKEKRKEYKK